MGDQQDQSSERVILATSNQTPLNKRLAESNDVGQVYGDFASFKTNVIICTTRLRGDLILRCKKVLY